jgi:hypothetical protein
VRYLFLITLFIVSLKSFGFTLNNNVSLAFNSNPVKVNVAVTTTPCTNIGIDERELLTIANDAVNQYWNRTPTSKLKIRSGSLIQTGSDIYRIKRICLTGTNCEPNPEVEVDSNILIACNTEPANFSSGSVLAVTVPNNVNGTTIFGSLIILNDIASTQFASKSRDEKVAIIAHEIGHAIGLGHSPVRDSLMYYSVVPNRRSLGQDDVDGMTYLYPKEQPIACGSIKDISKSETLLPIILGFLLMNLFYFKFRKKYFEQSAL